MSHFIALLRVMNDFNNVQESRSDGTFCVKLSYSSASLAPLQKGVPQGFILGPLIFQFLYLVLSFRNRQFLFIYMLMMVSFTFLQSNVKLLWLTLPRLSSRYPVLDGSQSFTETAYIKTCVTNSKSKTRWRSYFWQSCTINTVVNSSFLSSRLAVSSKAFPF